MGLPLLLLPLGLILAAGTIHPRLALFKRLFQEVVGPRPAPSPRPRRETTRGPTTPPRAWSPPPPGWPLASYLVGLPTLAASLLVANIALCLLSITTSYCVGCQVYFQYRRLRWLLRR